MRNSKAKSIQNAWLEACSKSVYGVLSKSEYRLALRTWYADKTIKENRVILRMHDGKLVECENMSAVLKCLKYNQKKLTGTSYRQWKNEA